MNDLRVRAYNVGFGDAILVTVPDRADNGDVTLRHLLIDVGNVLIGEGGQDDVFEPVIKNIQEELNGKPLDLYVMTHEHMDHVQGLLWAKEERRLEIKATHAWLTASAERDYYERFPDAAKQKLAFEQSYQLIERYYRTNASEASPVIRAMMLNNDPRSTADCIEHLRNVGAKTTYVSRETDVSDAHAFNEVSFEIWGPEEDTSVYYGRFRPMGLGLDTIGHLIAGSRLAAGHDENVTDEATHDKGRIVAPIPPPGVDAGAFYKLVSWRRRGIYDNLLAIDKAANNSSIVFVLNWRGWRLLFAGDAEERAWKEMNKRGLLGPVHFLKVGHHGSHNGTPEEDLLELILPATPRDDRERYALISTHEGTYNNVPDSATLEELARRCKVSRIGEDGDEPFIDMVFRSPT